MVLCTASNYKRVRLLRQIGRADVGEARETGGYKQAHSMSGAGTQPFGAGQKAGCGELKCACAICRLPKPNITSTTAQHVSFMASSIGRKPL
jgi:hypothetical protein